MGHLEFTILVLSAIQYTVLITTAQPTYVSHVCSGENYNSNSIFQSNLNRLLLSLSSSNNTVVKTGYYNTTAGRNPDSVFGSFQCSGFVTLENCQDCVDKATQEIMESDGCPNSKQAIIWYDECLLRYSDESYFSTMRDVPASYARIGEDVDNGDMFDRQSSSLLHSLIDEVSKDSSSINSGTLYANGETNYSSSLNLYGVVQCTSDISRSDCNTCLNAAISNFGKCCFGKSGGTVVLPSCYFRYETYRFNDSKVNSPPSSLVLPSPPPSSTNTTNKEEIKIRSPKVAIIVVVSLVTATLCTITILWCFCIQKRKVKKGNAEAIILNSAALQIDFNTIKLVTDNFSDNNKLGEGGFGSVYKGTLENGQEIAVKRLSRYSGHGGEEFKNEVMLVAELQHENLVRLLGFSLDKEEKLLIYEFMPNASLDLFLFDPVKCTMLDWKRRYNIIVGIAQGLQYLHEDSQGRIIHRDLKASNILLDVDMNPKISDFGTARMCMETQANTSKIIGTYGYMAPEYVKHGYFSEKSDVFSFGVVVLEILSSKKNHAFNESEIGGSQDLLSYAWRLWKNETPLEFIDPTLRQCCVISEVMISIRVGLLCVQPDTTDRPAMASIMAMLKRKSDMLPLPSAPAYFTTDQMSLKLAPWSVNGASISEL
ncbi:cysteine-rich receptor-like protein kinase 10 isoform X2 [Papaver somniferum]|uniref:cysteine-rich receptor-like protein kinase 10 isoform X2 n=1 Tax=Papaver somniferum TaxID=3469 RepID=UPI000E70416D|nr:cysteine-rich receptor-like protein kinase 10 isoform X2 [Papaver somniferum]